MGKIIAISGGPGTGKTTFVKKLTKKLNAVAILEGEEKDFPQRISNDIKNNKNLLELILFFRNKLIKEYQNAIILKKQGKIVILDTFYLTNDVYTDLWVQDKFEKKILLDMAKIDRQLLPLPDIIICLSANKKKIIEFIKLRNRNFEKDERLIQNYLNINRSHNSYFKKIPNTIFIDRSKLDFNNKKDLEILVKKIKKLIGK